MHPLDLLTEDCWKEILKRVKAPEDLWSCSETCLTFQEILWTKRSQFMFHLILPHILGYLPVPEFPRDNERQQWKALLKSRVVCKGWRTSIDKLRDAKYPNVFENVYQFASGEEIEQFLQTFETHAGNPFLGRIVTFWFPYLIYFRADDQVRGRNAYMEMQEDKAFFIRKQRQLLERFGGEIWAVKMFDYGENSAFCKNIQMVLPHMRNLRTLRLQGAGPNWLKLGWEMEKMAELATFIASNPLPALSQLENLWATGVNSRMVQFILEKYAPQLKFMLTHDLIGLICPEPNIRFSNLVNIVVRGLDAYTSLKGFRQLQSPLKDLTLEVDGNRSHVRVWPIDELFRNIGHLPIQRLTIWIASVVLGESGPIPAEQRPHHGSISSVYFAFAGGASFNFLLYCRELTSLHIVNNSRQPGVLVGHPDGVPELLDVGELLGQVGSDLYQSNIWDSLEHLQDFKLEKGFDNRRCDHYSRGEYEKRQLGKEGVAGEVS